MNKIKGKQIESVDLDQVLMESDLVVTSAVGAITSADFDSGKTYKTISRYKADGTTPKTIQELLEEIFTKDNNPTVTNPSVSLAVKYTAQVGGTKVVSECCDLLVLVQTRQVSVARIPAGMYVFAIH